MRGTIPIVLALLAVLAAPAVAEEESLTLENGLRVTLIPYPDATRTALVLLYDLGELTDPEGKSGMAHLMEHLYVTAAAGDIPARTAQEWFGAYRPPFGVNAQTGSDYTVVATVFPPDKLDAEIAEAALRMSDLKPTEEILAREKGRLILELGAMFDFGPALAAANRAREMVVPSPEGGRKGGVPDQVESISLEEAKARLAACYRPRNARLVLAGPLPDDARARIEKAFGGLPAGEPAPPARVRGPVSRGFTTPRGPDTPPGPAATAAFAVPAPGDPRYPAFLILAARASRAAALMSRSRTGAPPFAFAPVDEPEVVRVSVTLEKADQEAFMARIRELLVPAEMDPEDLAGLKSLSRQSFPLLFGFSSLQAMINPYGAAFGRGRAMQMGIDPVDLAKRIDAVTPEELLAAAKALFAPEMAGVVRLYPR